MKNVTGSRKSTDTYFDNPKNLDQIRVLGDKNDISKRRKRTKSGNLATQKTEDKLKAALQPDVRDLAVTGTKKTNRTKLFGSDKAPLKASNLSQSQKETLDMIRPDKIDTSKLANDSSQIADDIAKLARSAIDAIRAATDEFASKAGVSKSEAVDAVRNAGQAAVTGIGSVAGEARAMTETGLDTLGKSVIRNPLAALAIAAGTGLLLGLLSRSGQDTRR